MPLNTATEESFKNVARQMNKTRDPMRKGYFNFCPSETWTPNVNLYETDTAYMVCVDLAGVDKDKIDVIVEDHQLRLRGNRAVPMPNDTSEHQCHKVKIHLMEIDHGAFSREVELPRNVSKDGINATYRNGMLWIELPKK